METIELRDQPTPLHARVTVSAAPYRGHIFDVLVDDIVLETTGATMRREYMKHDDAVAVVALRPGVTGEEILLIRQYRHPVRAMMWEIPAGLLDVEGEDPGTAARRELAEETDLVAQTWEPLVQFLTSPGCSDEGIHVFLARELQPTEQRFAREDEEAEIETHWFPLGDVVQAVLSGRLRCPTLVAGVLAYCAKRGVTQREG
ncbi:MULTISPECIES: NUDIX hydrolase [unclassified Actinobaculum]|uniref:NUDIX domain-containing protein n=1 Tax=unclassified Actinobaculum TaxID=2609299 RepID=UPI000D5272D3|nr:MULTISPECIES: NUDIX hydrolase [unclassified Actinobaculum]AWE42444.1 ADP-ribose diphosphatase [Actinobaculum sp. 313]RTE48429.1 NUDIX hydrolase [Actinobaculum sp. 352]